MPRWHGPSVTGSPWPEVSAADPKSEPHPKTECGPHGALRQERLRGRRGGSQQFGGSCEEQRRSSEELLKRSPQAAGRVWRVEDSKSSRTCHSSCRDPKCSCPQSGQWALLSRHHETSLTTIASVGIPVTLKRVHGGLRL